MFCSSCSTRILHRFLGDVLSRRARSDLRLPRRTLQPPARRLHETGRAPPATSSTPAEQAGTRLPGHGSVSTLRSDIDPTLRSDAVVDLSLDNIEALAAEIAAESNIPLPRDTAPTPAPTKSLSSLAAPHPKAEWQIQKAALQQKLGPSGWAPRKRLSPDALSGIRALHAQYPDEYPTPVLAARFGVSAEAIRRILKSRWRPSDDEETARRERWSKRGEKIWSNMVELGVKPPKKWRDMGIGRGRQSGGRARQSGHRSSDQCTGMDRRRTPSSGPRDGARESGEEWDPGAETEPAPTLGERIL